MMKFKKLKDIFTMQYWGEIKIPSSFDGNSNPLSENITSRLGSEAASYKYWLEIWYYLFF